MALGEAHQGYSYQDLLCSYFILEDLTDQKVSDFNIDLKEYKEDKFDDFTLYHPDAVYKKQIKYSNETNDHTLTKDDLAHDGVYQLALFNLFNSWTASNHRITYVRLCLAWNVPGADLKDLLVEVFKESSFKNFNTRVFQIDLDKFWPKNGNPPSSWRKFNAQNLDRVRFEEFVRYLTIELELPKFSEDIYSPGPLEKLVLECIDDLGIGYFPNNHWRKEEFALALLAKVRKNRSTGDSLSTLDIYSYFGIKTDYGAIQQFFPINESQKIETISIYDSLLADLRTDQRVALVGEPGMGKSWLIENFKKYIEHTETHLIRHLCYTDLNDQFQKERILVDVFYANLINEILELFPDFKKFKRRFYASDLEELNLLLSEIKDETILVIDGLDHIERIYQFRNLSKEIRKTEIDIFGAINKLQPSSYVKILAVSQPIEDLAALSGFTPVTIPKWSVTDIRNYLKKVNITDVELNAGTLLSEYLDIKVAGNPLYLRYITEEIGRLERIDITHLDQIPVYNTGLTSYYHYLLNRSTLREQVPRILSGLSFTVSIEELKEITHEGDFVDEAITALLPVIKLNVSQNGYSIYHESFRRFIIDQLISNNISIEHTIYTPIIQWLEDKGVFTHQKSYRYYFQYVYETGSKEKLIPFATIDFILRSAYHGNHWQIISNNITYITKAVLEIGDVPLIFLVSELNKVISSAGDAFDESLIAYLRAVGHLQGFQAVADYLVYDGLPTLGLDLGLQACQLCVEFRVAAPWQTYLDFYRNKEVDTTPEMFRMIIRHHLEDENEEKLIRIAEQLANNENLNFRDTFQDVLGKFSGSAFVKELIDKSDFVKGLLNPEHQPDLSDLQVLNLRQEILDINHLSRREITALSLFTDYLTSANETVFKLHIDSLRNINWFYNWIKYNIGIARLASSDKPDQQQLLELFKQLTYDTEPFKGEPRTCDLYSIREWLHASFENGLHLISDQSIWPGVIDALIKVSDETTTNLRGSLGGPLSTDKLFDLLTEHINDDNRAYITDKLEELLDEAKKRHLHSYIAGYHYHLAILYAGQDKNKAEEHLNEGLKFSLGYTFRKDMALEDLLESIESVSNIDQDLGLQRLKDLLPLVYSVVAHTDGKETAYFPINWFEKFLAIDLRLSMIYLINRLVNVRIDWRHERSLESLLVSLNGKSDVITELLLTRTFPVLSSFKFLNYSLELINQLQETDPFNATRYLGTVMEKLKVAVRNHINADQVEKALGLVNQLDTEERIDRRPLMPKPSGKSDPPSTATLLAAYRSRKEFGEMNPDEIADYIRNQSLDDRDLQSFTLVFTQFRNDPEVYQPLIDSFFVNRYRPQNDFAKLENVFSDGGAMEIYYQVCRFVHQRDDYYNSLVNKEAFVKANKIDPDESFSVLRDKLALMLEKGYPQTLGGNLFNALTDAKVDKRTLISAWSNLYESMALRLPDTEPVDWVQLLSLPMDLDQNELLLCLLITRFRIGSTERYQWTLAGLAQVLYHDADKLIKPLLWFFSHWENFKRAIQVTILQLIYEYDKVHTGFAQHFQTSLRQIYPTRYFLIDALIEDMLHLSPRNLILMPQPLRYPTMNENEFEFFMYRNSRHDRLQYYFIDLKSAFEKTKANFKIDVIDQELLEVFGNAVYRMNMDNIYFADHILESINTHLYDELYKDIARTDLINDAKLALKGIVACRQSICARNSHLVKPSEMNEPMMRNEPKTDHGWVRLGHYELELFEIQYHKFEYYKLFAAVQFTADTKNRFPFAGESLPLDSMFAGSAPFEEETPMVYLMKEDDNLEDHHLIWLHPKVVTELKLSIQSFSEGLYAVDSDGNIGLKFCSWRSDYIATGGSDRLTDEIPKLVGGELLIREDLYSKLVGIAGTVGTYFSLRKQMDR